MNSRETHLSYSKGPPLVFLLFKRSLQNRMSIKGIEMYNLVQRIELY